MVPQPLPAVDLMAEAAKLWEAVARGAQAAQQARAQEDGGGVGQSGAEAAAPADTVEETGRGGAVPRARRSATRKRSMSARSG